MILIAAQPAVAVDIDWVGVGDPGNAADDTGFGAVSTAYRISETEVTNAQYTEFLNAVAATDSNALYNTSMGSGFGGITRSGSSGSFSYSAITGRENMPVNFVSFYDALRFANWLHNGQPVGAQGVATTEDGAYTITAQGILDNSVARNANATIFLPSEDEWYKAAFYDAVTASYLDYPAGSDTAIACAAPSATPNTANCGSVVGDLTVVGSYTGSVSPNGTFDQGGNVQEWNEGFIGQFGTGQPVRGLRGGTFQGGGLSSSDQNLSYTTSEIQHVGFRVAMVPEPSTGLLVMLGLSGLAWKGRSRGA